MLISLKNILIVRKKTDLARYENSPYEDVPLWNFYTIACNLHQSIEMNGVNKLIQSTTNVKVFNGITDISDDDNSSSTIIVVAATITTIEP